MKQALFIFIIALTTLPARAQNTLGGRATQVPEAEVARQSRFVDAEGRRLLGRFDQAILLYQTFLKDEPANDAAWYGLARSHTARQEYSEALDALAKAVEIDRENRWYQVLQADLYEKTGRIKDAASVYESLTKRHPQVPEFYQRLAYLAVLSGNPQGGLKALERLEKLTGLTEESASKKHMIYVGLGEDKKAAAELENLANHYPEEPSHRHRLAQFYETIGDAAGARRVYEDILRRFPDDPLARLGLLDKSKGSSDAAYLQSLQPLFANPQVPVDAKVKEILPYFSKLQANSDAGLTRSLLDLGAILEKTHPDEPKAWSLSGDLLYHANRPEEALEKYRHCIRLNPTVFAVWHNLLTILADRHQYDEMFTAAEQAMDAFPNNAKAYYFYGLAAIEKGRPDDALAPLEQALLMTGNNVGLRLDIHDQLGLALLRKKDVTGALARYEQALAKGGDQHAGILEHFGDALFQNGERGKALQYWQKALALRKNPELEQKIANGKM